MQSFKEHPRWAMDLTDKRLATAIKQQQRRADKEAERYGMVGPHAARERLSVLKWERTRRGLS